MSMCVCMSWFITVDWKEACNARIISLHISTVETTEDNITISRQKQTSANACFCFPKRWYFCQ